jgi:hypothetical protein
VNHGIMIIGSGDWALTVNHQGDVWTFDTQQLVYAMGSPYQMLNGATCSRKLDGSQLLWYAGWGCIGFNTSGAILDVRAEKLKETQKGQIDVYSTVDHTMTTSSDPRLLLALTPVGLKAVGREASESEESGATALPLPPHVIEWLRAGAAATEVS